MFLLLFFFSIVKLTIPLCGRGEWFSGGRYFTGQNSCDKLSEYSSNDKAGSIYRQTNGLMCLLIFPVNILPYQIVNFQVKISKLITVLWFVRHCLRDDLLNI